MAGASALTNDTTAGGDAASQATDDGLSGDASRKAGIQYSPELVDTSDIDPGPSRTVIVSGLLVLTGLALFAIRWVARRRRLA